MPARIELREGQSFTDARFTRRVVGLFERDGKPRVVYSKGGDRVYQCGREQFLRFRRSAVEVTDCSITIHADDLLKEEDDGDR